MEGHGIKMNKLLEFLKQLFNFDKSPEEATVEILEPGPRTQAIVPVNTTVIFKTYPMKLDIHRKWISKKSTIGELYIDGVFECYTLEDTVRNEKVYGETAIPTGRYVVAITRSPKFKCKLPLLKDVPAFKGVRIHPGNTHKDTEGCILVGQTKAQDFIGRSRRAFNKLFKKLETAKREGKEIVIEID